MRVLYVGDNLLGSQLVCRILNHDGDEVVHIPDSRAGIEAAARQTPGIMKGIARLGSGGGGVASPRSGDC